MLANAWHSKRTKERRWHCAIPQFICGVCLLERGDLTPEALYIPVPLGEEVAKRLHLIARARNLCLELARAFKVVGAAWPAQQPPHL